MRNGGRPHRRRGDKLQIRRPNKKPRNRLDKHPATQRIPFNPLKQNSHYKMETPLPPPLHPCEACGKPASRLCDCRDAPTYDEATGPKETYYCSPECEKRDWMWHGELCLRLQNRKRLHRGGELIQKMLYTFREKLEICRLVQVEEEDGKLYFTGMKQP